MKLNFADKNRVMAEHAVAVEKMSTIMFQDNEYMSAPDTAVFSKLCVQVARKNGVVAVKDSKNPTTKPLMFSNQEWTAFINGAKQGLFDV